MLPFAYMPIKCTLAPMFAAGKRVETSGIAYISSDMLPADIHNCSGLRRKRVLVAFAETPTRDTASANLASLLPRRPLLLGCGCR